MWSAPHFTGGPDLGGLSAARASRGECLADPRHAEWAVL